MKSTIKIAPSILSADFSVLGEEIKKLDKSGCDYIHIDVMDGHFVPNITIGPDVIKSLRNLTTKTFDVHLMINPVKKYITDFYNSGADIITIHYEIDENVLDCLKLIKDLGIKSGLSIKPSTSPYVVEKYMDNIDLVLVMTVEPGFGGQSFIENQLKKIKIIKKLVGNKKIEIEVDGGINKENAKKVIKAGANVLVSGSNIFRNSNYKKNILELRN